MSFYENVLSLCKSRNVRITNLELSLGLSRGSLSKTKDGSSPSASRVQKIANYFGVSTDWLITDHETNSEILVESDLIPLAALIQDAIASTSQDGTEARYNLIKLIGFLKDDQVTTLFTVASSLFPAEYAAAFVPKKIDQE